MDRYSCNFWRSPATNCLREYEFSSNCAWMAWTYPQPCPLAIRNSKIQISLESKGLLNSSNAQTLKCFSNNFNLLIFLKFQNFKYFYFCLKKENIPIDLSSKNKLYPWEYSRFHPLTILLICYYTSLNIAWITKLLKD